MQPDPIGQITQQPGTQPTPSDRLAQMREAAIRLEAGFLAEMLKSTGVGLPPDAFGGGPGEEQFASVLRNAQANKMAEAGGIGLAEQIFEAMRSRYET